MCAAKLADTGLLMPKATAIWMIENTTLTFEQIGDFTGLHPIEIQAMADGEIGYGIVGRDPVVHNELSQEELDKAIADTNYRMRMAKTDLPSVKARSKGPRYTPVSKRGDKPDAIAYLIKHHPELSDAQIGKLVGTTKPTIQSVRDRTHLNSANIKPRHPVDVGLCTYAELEAASRKGLRAQGKDPDDVKNHVLINQEQLSTPDSTNESSESAGSASSSGFDFSNFLKSN